MLREDQVYIRHILDAAEKAIGFVKGRAREDLEKEEMLALSLVRLLEIIGEAAGGVSTDCSKKYPDIPWKKMVGLRNRLIHGYYDIDLDIVWDTVMSDLPGLVAGLKEILPEGEEDTDS